MERKGASRAHEARRAFRAKQGGGGPSEETAGARRRTERGSSSPFSKRVDRSVRATLRRG